MSTQNAELTNQETQEKENSGRNPIILAGGLVILVGAFLLLIFGGAIFGDNDQAAEQVAVQETDPGAVQLPLDGPPLQVGDQPYEFALQNLDGETVTLSQFIGQPIIINFWATWCGPCRIEMPEIQAVWEEHRDDGLVVLALDQDETAPEVQAYFEELGLSFTPLLDDDSNTAKNFGLQGTLPSTVFVNPDGKVSVIHRGVMTRGQLDTFLAETLSDNAQS